jgi:hypothetical protein
MHMSGGMPVSAGTSDGTQVMDNTFQGTGRAGLGIAVPSGGGPSNATIVTGNRFIGNAMAGLFVAVDTNAPPPTSQSATMTIADNMFDSNGFRSNGVKDINGSLIDDGLHVGIASGLSLNVVVRNNHASNDADRGIEAQPATVIDGGGNTSTGDPNGCLGVVCG